MQKTEFVRQTFAHFIKSPGYTPHFNRMYPKPGIRYVFALLLMFSGAGIPLAIGLVIGGVLKSRRRRQKRRALVEAAERSELLMTFVLLANNRLGQSRGVVAPGLVIGSFDPDVSLDDLAAIAGEIDAAAAGEHGDEAQKAINELMSDLDYREGRRRRLPEAITKGQKVDAFDLNIIGDFLPESQPPMPILACLAEPGEGGTIQHVPLALLAEYEQNHAEVASLTEMYRRIQTVDRQRYDVAVGGLDRITEGDLEQISRELGLRIPPVYQAFLLKCAGCYVVAKEDLWPRYEWDGRLQTSPYWTFLNGFYVLGVGEAVPPEMRVLDAAKELRQQGVTDLLPFMGRTMEADCWCFDPDGVIVRWDHEQPEKRERLDLNFGDLVVREFDELEGRLERVLATREAQDKS